MFLFKITRLKLRGFFDLNYFINRLIGPIGISKFWGRYDVPIPNSSL